MRRFKFTIAFLVVSALTLGIAALVILNVSSGVEEENISAMMAEQSARDARLLAETVSRVLSDDAESVPATHNIAVANSSPTSAATEIGAFLGNSDVIRLALYEIDGQSAWSSDSRDVPISGARAELFQDAAGGKLVSGLIRGETLPSGGRTLDVVESYVPFVGADGSGPVRVLGVTRDVTDALSTRVGATRGAMFRSTILTLGAGFFFILAFVVIADRAVWISKRRELRKERELGEQRLAAARLDASNRELQLLNEERSKLIGLVSHELRTPLTGVLAFAEILAKRQTGENAEKNREHIEVIKRSGSHLLEMVNEMLDMSRLEATELPLDITDVDVNALIEDVNRQMAPILQNKNQKLQVFGDINGYRVQADRNRLEQVLMNLLSNASKYSPEGAPIQLAATISENDLAVTVRDRGIGIDEQDRRLIFGKFYRVDRVETRSTPGTGLGLAIVESIIERHGGEISVDDNPGGGSRFVFRIPTTVRERTPSSVRIGESTVSQSYGPEIAPATD